MDVGVHRLRGRRATVCLITIAGGGLILSGCGGDVPQAAAPQTVTRTVIATPSPSASTSAPSSPTTSEAASSPSSTGNPFAGFKPDKGSSYTLAQQKFLYLLKRGTSEETVSNAEIQLVIVGGAMCSQLDDIGDDKDAWSTWYDTLQLSGNVPPEIPANYIALAAGVGLCPKHKTFIMNYFDDQFD